jgi:hypothetical protein
LKNNIEHVISAVNLRSGFGRKCDKATTFLIYLQIIIANLLSYRFYIGRNINMLHIIVQFMPFEGELENLSCSISLFQSTFEMAAVDREVVIPIFFHSK